MQKLLLVLFAVVGCALGANLSAGLVAQPEGRIVGGSAANIASFPWQVSVQRNQVHICGGALYSNYIVITAAHCLQGLTAYDLSVRIGTSNWRMGAILSYVNRFKIHEGYNPVTMDNDIALIRLTSNIYANGNVKYIDLATTSPSNGVSAVVSGWGTVAYGYDVLPDELQSVEVNIISRDECNALISRNGRKILPSMLCAAARGKNFCYGDSGSPLVHNNRLVGIASWNYDCGAKSYPGVYADIPALRTWIVKNANAM